MNTNTVPLDQLVAFLMVADGLSEGAADEMYHRFMEAPHTVLNYLASLGTQTKKLPVLGDVVVAEWICQDIASADVAWYGATDAFIRLVEDCKSTYSGDRVSELLDLLELEHNKAYGRLLKDAEETSKSVDMEYIQEAVNRIFVGELSYDPSWTHPGTYSLTATENAGGEPDKYTISPVPYYSIWSTPGYRLATEFFWNEVTTSESTTCSGCSYSFRFVCGQRAITVCSHENLLEIEQNGAKRFFRGTPLNLNTHSDYSEIFNMFLQFAEAAEYSLQWDAFSEEQIRAGQLMERLGNHKSKVVVPALIEYMERHPEVMLPDGKINIVVQQTQTREQMETMVKNMARAAVEELMHGMQLVPVTAGSEQPPAPAVNLDDMLNNLDVFKGL